jgi:predicted GIY-YIG superfamily endonuclease
MSTPSETPTPQKRWFVYVLYSATTGRLYTGVSTDPRKRMAKHNDGKGAKNTRYGKPWLLVHVENKKDKGEALKREAEIKKMKRKDKLILVGLAA